MRYADFYDCDICNGSSIGMSLFVVGCPLHCEACFNSDIWDYDVGKEWTPETEAVFLKKAGRSYIKRITLVGGSPLCDRNVVDVNNLILKIRSQYPDKEIWVYTGYTWDEVVRDGGDEFSAARLSILSNINILVDGRFERDKRDLSLAFRGSSNQRIIDVPQTLKAGEVVLYR